MRTVAVYATPRAILSGRDALIHEAIGTAFAAVADLEVGTLDADDFAGAASMPGLRQFSLTTPTIALGRAAHMLLSDVRKRTLIVEDLESDDGRDDLEEEIETLLWSSVNTTKIVALGEPAWHSVQLLPVAVRHFYHVPPLRIPSVDGARRNVLVINHDDDDRRALSVAEALERAGSTVRCVGRFAAAPESSVCRSWSVDADLHVHVGGHTLAAGEPRIVDSWCSERPVVQLVGNRGARPETAAGGLTVEDNGDGFICESAEDVIAVCNDLLDDQVLRRKMIAAGQNSVAPLLETWQAIAEDLLT